MSGNHTYIAHGNYFCIYMEDLQTTWDIQVNTDPLQETLNYLSSKLHQLVSLLV